ncbi:MAG: hypothetical protein LBL64_07420 [Treponema sp.]|jgi:uncharacterized protein YkwD|nr:hypothetical protein [Treponema sp.]
MKKAGIPAMMILCIFLSACVTGIPAIDDLFMMFQSPSINAPEKNAGSNTVANPEKKTVAAFSRPASPSSRRADPDAAHWDIGRLDTAGNADYLSPLEKDIILEMNKVRSDPAKYAELYIQSRLQYYNGNLYQMPGQIAIQTNEGKKAVEGCVNALSKMRSVELLLPEKGLFMAARDHAVDQGKTGKTGHDGSDKSTPSSRTARYGKGSYIGENIAYGSNTGREVVVDLLIDDGVPSRGHRQNIMKRDYNQTGTATGPHPQYGSLCVINYARDYKSGDQASNVPAADVRPSRPAAQTAPVRQSSNYTRPDSYETAYAYRSGTADPLIRNMPRNIESLRSKDPAEYVRQTAVYIVKNAKDPFDKIKKTHDLVTLTIRYDAASFLANRIPPQDYESVVKSRMAVCEGYSNLFKKLCDEMAVECDVIHGYARGVGSSPFADEDPSDSNHAWNAVNIGNAWYLVDCTWDAGNLNGKSFQADYGTDYLFLKPEHFIYDHFPENSRQQLLEKPVSAADFSRLPFYRPKFFEAVSIRTEAPDKVLRVEGKIELEFSMNDDSIPDLEVYDENGGKRLEHHSLVQKEGDRYKAYLSFPSQGNYVVRFFIKKQNARRGESCAEFGIAADAGTNVLYPLQYASFGDAVSLISPIEMPLRKNTRYEFRIRAHDKKIIALMYNKQFIPFEKDGDGIFFLEAEIPASVKEVTIGSANSERGSYAGIVKYLVH